MFKVNSNRQKRPTPLSTFGWLICCVPLLFLGACEGVDEADSSSTNKSDSKIWTAQWGSPAGVTTADALVLTSNESSFVAGSTTAALSGKSQIGLQDFYITRFDSNKQQVWTIQEGAVGAKITAKAIGIDKSGNLIMAGTTDRGLHGKSLMGEQDLYLAQYDQSGQRQWTVLAGGLGANFELRAMAIDANSGEIYVVGSTDRPWNGNAQSGVRDGLVAKFSEVGQLLWARQYGNTGGVTIVSGIALSTAEPAIYITGSTTRPIGNAAQKGAQDLFIAKGEASSGNLQWVNQEGGAGGTTSGNGIRWVAWSGTEVIPGYNSDTYKPISGEVLYVIGSADQAAATLLGGTRPINQIGSSNAVLGQYDVESGQRRWFYQIGLEQADVEGLSLSGLNSDAGVWILGSLSSKSESKSFSGFRTLGKRDYFVTHFGFKGEESHETSGCESATCAIVSDTFGSYWFQFGAPPTGSLSGGALLALRNPEASAGTSKIPNHFYVVGSTNQALIDHTQVGLQDGFLYRYYVEPTPPKPEVIGGF